MTATGALSALKRAYLAIEQLESRLEAAGRQRRAPIAICGIGCRLPGAVSTPDELWTLVAEGRDAVERDGSRRFDAAFLDPDLSAAGRTHTLAAGLLDDVEGFDARLFGIAPREAITMDPQQRIVLETAWMALEDAGLPPLSLDGARTGVFLGVGHNEYREHAASALATEDAAYLATGNALNAIAGRVAYCLALRGPALAVDTACSSSLVAIHLAMQSLRSGECDRALAGGVNLLLSEETFVPLSKAGVLAADGRCKAFDARADGYVRAEGCGVLVLRRLDDALAAGDRVLAVLRGSAVNQDGRSASMTAPSGASQRVVLKAALDDAGISPREVQWVEAHGTGTELGDPIEAGALDAVYASERDGPLLVSSIKTNIGHAEAAAGVASVVKIVMALRHGAIPPHLHFEQRNPHIQAGPERLAIPTEMSAWEPGERGRIAAVSSFGFSGTNAHVLISEPPAAEETRGKDREWHLIPLSARSEVALRTTAERLQGRLVAASDLDLADVARTTQLGREHLAERAAFVVRERSQLAAGLDALASGTTGRIPSSWREPGRPASPRIAFLFPGQGSQYAGMARGLYDAFPAFREVLDACTDGLIGRLDRPLRDVLWGDAAHLLSQTSYTQPALFSLEVGLARLWQSFGIEPAALIGHSVGELAAATVAGVFSLEAGLDLVAARGALVAEVSEAGEMLVAAANEASIEAVIEPYGGDLSIAAVNGPRQTVVSGRREAVREVARQLDDAGVRTSALEASHAFHSPLMEPILPRFAEKLASLELSAAEMPMVSNLTGKREAGEMSTPGYWVQHLREPVRFADGVRALEELGCDTFLEIGPQPTLLALCRACMASPDARWIASLRRRRDDVRCLLEAVAALHAAGADVDFEGVARGASGRLVSLPPYPFERQRFWVEPAGGDSTPKPPVPETPDTPALRLVGRPPQLAETVFETVLAGAGTRIVEEHRVLGRVVVAGGVHVSLALAAAEVLVGAEAVELADVFFHQPLFLSASEKRVVTLVALYADAPRESGWSLELTSTDADELAVGGRLPVAPLRHASFQVLAPSRQRGGDRVFRVGSERCPRTQGQSEFYDWLSSHSEIEHGPSFRWVNAFRCGDEEAIAELRVPAVVREPGRGVLHPGLLDACFQTLGALALSALGERKTAVPLGIDRLRVHRRIGREPLVCHTRLRRRDDPGPSGVVQGDVRLLDASGAEVASIEGLAFRAVQSDFASPDRSDAISDLYVSEWVPGARLDDGGEDRSTDTEPDWLLAGERVESLVPIARSLEAGGGRVTLVALPSEADANSDAEAFGAALAARLGERPRWRGVVIRVGDEERTLPDPGRIAEAAARACSRVLCGVHALLRADVAVPRLFLVTRAAQAVHETSGVAGLPAASVWGLARSLATEHPELRCTRIDLEALPPDGRARPEEARDLATELQGADAEDEVAWRGGVRYVARLGPLHGGEVAGESSRRSPLEIDPTGTHLITGGLGEVGLEIARWLVSHGARSLGLLSRRSPSSEAARGIERLQECGARVHVLQADVGDADALASAVESLESAAPSIVGVVHAAGVLDDGALILQTPDRLRAVLAPKVAGAANLCDVLAARRLDYFVCASALAGLLGAPGQGPYAAANSFLDALAHDRRSRGLPGLSAQFGPWSKGMAAQLASPDRERLATAGVTPLASADALAGLEEAIESGKAQVAIARVDWAALASRLPAVAGTPRFSRLRSRSGHPPPGPESGELRRRLSEARPNARSALLADALAEHLGLALGLEPGEAIPLDEGFFDLGLDSLMALDLKQRLDLALDVSLPSTVVFNYTTIAELTDHLLREVVELPQAATPARAASAAARPASRAGDLPAAEVELDSLSSDELAALLAKEIEPESGEGESYP